MIPVTRRFLLSFPCVKNSNREKTTLQSRFSYYLAKSCRFPGWLCRHHRRTQVHRGWRNKEELAEWSHRGFGVDSWGPRACRINGNDEGDKNTGTDISQAEGRPLHFCDAHFRIFYWHEIWLASLMIKIISTVTEMFLYYRVWQNYLTVWKCKF